MVTYNYSVSLEGGYSTIQAAVNTVAEELSSLPTIERDIEISVGEGTYPGFTIPDASLYALLNSSYRLVIKSSGDHFPIIDFNHSSEDQIVGVNIGAGNPNVTIKGLRVQYFAVGVRSGINSHYPIVHNCIINNNRNAGIFFEQSDEAQAVQNVVINGDYGIVSRLGASVLLLHNTIFMNGAISSSVGRSVSCIWVELARDYGNGLTDTGTLHMLGNVAWNTTGRCLTLFVADVEATGAIVSNYNDWVKGDNDSFIVVEDNAFFTGSGARPRQTFSTLAQWKQLGFDADSKSEDPRFISPVRIRSNRNGYAIDLNILPVSPVLGMVPSFAYNAGAAALWLPSYADSSLVAKDIIRGNRGQSLTAAGANEKASTSGFFGQDVFSDPLDLGLSKSCATDPFFNILFKFLDIWFPKFKRGYFYSNEREFYLYSKKECKHLGEIARTKFYLPGKISYDREIKLYISGVHITDPSYYDIHGNILYIYHKDLPIVNGNEEVELRAWIYTWNGDGFNYSPVLYRYKINEGETKYFLPSDYVNVGPVVVTDDMAYPTDSDYVTNREFSVVFDDEEQKSEIVFANDSNILYNGQFDYGTDNQAPSTWQSSNARVIAGINPQYSAVGRNVCKITDGFIRQVVPVDYSGAYTLSFHAMSYGSGQCEYGLEYYDSNYDLLGYKTTGSFNLRDSWRRYSMTLGTSGSDYNVVVPQKPYMCADLGTKHVPTRAAYVSFKLGHLPHPAYTGDMFLSAVQYEEGPVPTLYHRRPYFNELTVEYETKEDDYYINTHLAMSTISTLMSDGFIYIPEASAISYDGPDTPVITTLHEWKWSKGRKEVLPWARTKGKDKLRKRPDGLFHLIPHTKPEQISPVGLLPHAISIDISPSTPRVSVGDTNGVGILISTTDSDGNPHALMPCTISIADDNLRYPGSISKRIYGLKEQLGTTITTKTSNSGTVPITWVPPDEIATTYKGPVPKPRFVSSRNETVSFIHTEYPVSLTANGNVIVLDYLGRPIQTYSSQIDKGYYSPVYGNNTSAVTLAYPAKPSSVRVIVDGVQYTESPINILDSNQFFVDYENSIVNLKGRVTNIYIEYIPSYVFVNHSDPYKIFFYHDKIFGNYANEITVGYDVFIKLLVTIKDPAKQGYAEQSFELIGQNPLVKKANVYNFLALDI